MVKNESYITIQGWMVNELKLKGNDLFVYAIIYGFSQDGESKFTGSLSYLADWCNSTKQGIQKNLANLLALGLIEKKEFTKNNIKFCEYSCTPYNSVAHPIQLSCINNIDNTIGDTEISKDISGGAEDEFDGHAYTAKDFLGSVKKSSAKQSTKGKTLYSKCIDEIDHFTHNLAEREILIRYLNLRLSMTDKPIYGVNQWIGILDKLSEVCEKDKVSVTAVVKQSIERGYASFYPIKERGSYSKRDKFSEGTGLSCEQSTDTAEERAEILQKEGSRAWF